MGLDLLQKQGNCNCLNPFSSSIFFFFLLMHSKVLFSTLQRINASKGRLWYKGVNPDKGGPAVSSLC